MMSWNKNENTWNIYIAAIEIVLYSLAFCQLQMNLGLSQLHSNSFILSFFYVLFFFFLTSFAVEAMNGTQKKVLSFGMCAKCI